MKATVRFIVEYEVEVEIETTLEPGFYEFEGFHDEDDEIFNELERLQDEIHVFIPENETSEYVPQSLTLTTLKL